MVKPDPHTAQQIADGSTWFTYAMLGISACLAWLDTHSSGLMALAAIFTALVNWYYRRKAAQWNGIDRRSETD